MKKPLAITILGILLFTNISYARLSDEAWREMFNGCYYSGVQMKELKAYCTCYTSKFDINFSDDSALEFLETAGDLTKNPTVKKWARQCYDKYK